MADDRRWALLRVHTPWLVGALKQTGAPVTFEVVRNGLPPDASFVRFGYEDFSGDLMAVVQSASFEPVPLNERLPELPSIHVRTEAAWKPAPRSSMTYAQLLDTLGGPGAHDGLGGEVWPCGCRWPDHGAYAPCPKHEAVIHA